MTEPHATCATCNGPLYPFLARRSDEGWVHVRCPCVICRSPFEGRGSTCSPRCRRRLAAKSQEARRVAAERARIEDLAWMAETGESLTGAARRIGLSRESLERWMRQRDLRDVLAQLQSREPYAGGWQNQNGAAA